MENFPKIDKRGDVYKTPESMSPKNIISFSVPTPGGNTSPNFTLQSNNNTLKYIDTKVFSTGLHWFLNILMVLITLLGMTGNGLICFFFATKKVKFTSFNLLLLNLSAADLMADIFAYLTIFIELEMLRQFSQEAANILCAFTIGITSFVVVLSVSILTLAYISLNRYVFISYPMKTAWFKSRRNTICIIALIWIVCVGTLSPNVISFRYSQKYSTCPREWPKNFNVQVWTIILIFPGFLLPIAVMLLALFAAKRQFRKMEGETASNTASMQRKKRTVKMLGFLILAFFLCMAPAIIYLVLSLAVESIWPEGHDGEIIRMKIIRITFLICLINTVADPVIYGYNNKEFQTCFKAIFKKLECHFCAKRSTEENEVPSTKATSSGTLQVPSNTNEECTGPRVDTRI